MKIGNGEPPEPCCGRLYPAPYFETVYFPDCVNKGESPKYNIPATVSCEVTIEVVFIPQNGDDFLSCQVITEAGSIAISPGVPTNIVVNPGGFLLFAVEGSTNFSNYVDIYAANLTCGTNYGLLGSIAYGISPECTIYPLWDLFSFGSTDQVAQSSTYQYTGGANSITLEIYTGTVVPNPDTDIIVYVGPDPIPTNNPLFPVVLSGNVTVSPIFINMNPGEYFTIIASTDTPDKCSIYTMEIYNRCPGRNCEQYFLIEEISTNRIRC